ncbi:hypothetical protein BpHYR1_030328 [Brachionus plicatilis]|uniref:Reverse transcriptase domain-containing protein n=1 Tax=Brachionus plicatilis TaxID=10195 RepID=A0A3M7RR62_BRAPC|nr:hypothetical protein BpHYR1_030328 [Brachionus plicatilis]
MLRHLMLAKKELVIGACLNGLNLSIIAYCDDIIILSPSYGHAMRLLEDCFRFAKEWKMEFNPRKSASLTMTKSGVNCQEKFVIDNVQLSNVDGFEYLGLPFGSNSFISDFIEENLLDNILIPNSMLSELDTRQRLLLKKIIGLKKFTCVSPLYDALKLESFKQLMKCPLCKEVFHFSRESQTNSDKKNTSFCEQLKRLEKRLFINCLEYESKIVKA